MSHLYWIGQKFIRVFNKILWKNRSDFFFFFLPIQLFTTYLPRDCELLIDRSIFYESQDFPDERAHIYCFILTHISFFRTRTRAVNHHKAPSLQFRVLLGHKELPSFSHLDIVPNHIAFYFLWNVNSIKITILFLFLRSFNKHKLSLWPVPLKILSYSSISEHSEFMQSIRAGGGNKRRLGPKKKAGGGSG